jgi:hypothetical protein
MNAMSPISLSGFGLCAIAVWHRCNIGGSGPVRRGRVRGAVFALLALTSTTHAQSVLFTYDQWERLSIGLREIYLSGAIDALSTIAVPAQASTAKHYNDCLRKQQITAHQVSEGMSAIVQTQPELRPKPATTALMASLIKLCGTPAD